MLSSSLWTRTLPAGRSAGDYHPCHRGTLAMTRCTPLFYPVLHLAGISRKSDKGHSVNFALLDLPGFPPSLPPDPASMPAPGAAMQHSCCAVQGLSGLVSLSLPSILCYSGLITHHSSVVGAGAVSNHDAYATRAVIKAKKESVRWNGIGTLTGCIPIGRAISSSLVSPSCSS